MYSEVPELQRRIATEAASARDRVIDCWLQDLNDAQKTRVREEWAHLFQAPPYQLDLLRWQLKEALEAPSPSQGNPLREVLALPQFDVSMDGALVVQPIPERISKSTKRMLRNLQKYLRDPTTSKFLELTANQTQEINALYDSYLAATEEAEAVMRSEEGDGDVPKARRRYDEQCEALAEDYLPKVREVLLPVQWSALESIAEATIRRAYGPLNDLVKGKLGEALSLSEDEKQQLVKRAEQAIGQLDEEARKLEQLVYDELFRELEDSQKKALEEAMGEPLKHSSVSLILLQRNLDVTR